MPNVKKTNYMIKKEKIKEIGSLLNKFQERNLDFGIFGTNQKAQKNDKKRSTYFRAIHVYRFKKEVEVL